VSKSNKRWYFKDTKIVEENTFQVTLFLKNEDDTTVRIHSDLLCAALGVDQAILNKSAAPDLVTLFFKQPELINTGTLTVKNHRLLMDVIEAMIVEHDRDCAAFPVLSFETIDRYIGKADGFLKMKLMNSPQRRLA
jgi:hypothetical protein